MLSAGGYLVKRKLMPNTTTQKHKRREETETLRESIKASKIDQSKSYNAFLESALRQTFETSSMFYESKPMKRLQSSIIQEEDSSDAADSFLEFDMDD